MRYPPSEFVAGDEHWQAQMSCADFQRIARTADELGFDAICVSEHLALPREFEANMGAYFPHAFSAMSFIAGATSRIKVNSMVMVLPYHHPVALAKAIATLDVMSSGRVMATFGVGMAPAEFRALGVSFDRRGQITDEYIQAMKVLWSEEHPAFAGDYVQFGEIVFEPKPVQRPYPPIWFGGRALVSLRRAAIEGDGWAPSGAASGKGPWFEGPEQLPALLEGVREQRARAGNKRPFDVFVSVEQAMLGPHHELLPPTFDPHSAQQIVDEVGRLADLGVTWTMVSRPNAQPASLDAYLEDLHWFAQQILMPMSEDKGAA
jgi:probable F420-dependent oxidoreductase